MEGFNWEEAMKIRKIAAVAVLVLGSLAADNVAPSKAELEAMYDKAFRAFDTNNFPDALKDLDAIDARQPDLAESQNLRGVIMMRQGIYDKAEAALHEALRIDSRFWNARFNLAEIPFLKKDWAEARNRFQELLSSNASELQGEATQLIQYKILLTYLLEGKENMVDSILAKFELSPDTPAVHYANAAIALQQNKTKEAKDWMAQAEKNFSPQLNKLFAESLYEVGWLQKQPGQTRAALELTSAAERAAKSKAFARSRVEQARQAYQQRDFVAARKFIDDADAADPNQAATSNLRGEILLEQKQFDQAEAEFKKALKADSRFRQAQFNLALVPLKKKDYATARDRFEALLSKTAGGEKSEAAQLIKFNVYITWLLEDNDSRAQKLMEQFQFTGDTPALYYAQAAWEFKHNNPTKATDWITSAKKIYSPALNLVFADSFYDLGWLQSPALATSTAPAAEAATALTEAQTESSPAIEPSPIPGAAAAKAKVADAKTTAPAIAGMEATGPKPEEAAASTAVTQPVAVPPGSYAAGSPAKPEEIPTSPAPNFSPVVETPVAAAAAPAVREQPAVAQAQPGKAPVQLGPPVAAAKAPVVAAASTTPATALAPARVGEVSGGKFEIGNLFAIILVLAGIGVIGWVIVFEIRRREIQFPSFRRAAPATDPQLEGMEYVAPAPVQREMKVMPRLISGPRQVSLKLKASEPSLRREVVPLWTPSRLFGGAPAVVEGNGEHAVQPVETSESEFESVAPVIAMAEPAAIVEPEPIAIQPEPAIIETPVSELTTPVNMPEPIHEQWAEPAAPEMRPPVEWAAPVAEMPVSDVAEPAAIVEPEPIAIQPEAEPVFAQAEAMDAPEFEPIGQGQPIPQLTPVEEASMIDVTEPEPAGFSEFRPVSEPPFVPEPAIIETPVSELTTPVNMPEPIHEQWAEPAAAEMRPPVEWAAPVAEMPVSDVAEPAAIVEPTAGAVQTAVHLTFAFEIASMQLTPTFKMGALQLRPASKVVTMRLAGSAPQPEMPQVTFEIARIQPAGGTLGSVRLTPSQQQCPTVVGSPSFTVGGLHLVSDFAAAPLQLTPSQQGQATVQVVAPFQIANVEFSPSFEISSIVLNSNSNQVSVQMPSAGGAPVEGAPVFEISNLQLTDSGEIEMMQLNLLGHGPKSAA
jgi:tetratricopeptide (TPR) repeat protein